MNPSRSLLSEAPSPKPAGARARLLDAARDMIRQRGFTATSIDDLCKAAGATKGAFFHHFASKESLGVAVADYWSETTAALFASAPYHDHADPLDRLLAYIEFRSNLLDGEVADFTCLVGTMVQEVYTSSGAIRAACDASISGHAATLEADIAAAIAKYGIRDAVTPESLALHTQAVLQGAFILAKAKGSSAVARGTAAHLARYVRYLFNKD